MCFMHLSYDVLAGHVVGDDAARLVGSFKKKVSFAEYCLFYRSLLQKRPTFLGSLLIVAS